MGNIEDNGMRVIQIPINKGHIFLNIVETIKPKIVYRQNDDEASDYVNLYFPDGGFLIYVDLREEQLKKALNKLEEGGIPVCEAECDIIKIANKKK